MFSIVQTSAYILFQFSERCLERHAAPDFRHVLLYFESTLLIFFGHHRMQIVSRLSRISFIAAVILLPNCHFQSVSNYVLVRESVVLST